MKKIPCIICTPELWEYIIPYLDKWGYIKSSYYCGHDLENNNLLVINAVGSNEIRGIYVYNNYSEGALCADRELVTDVEEFLERAAKLKGFTYKRKDMKFHGMEIKPGMVIILDEANTENVPYVVFPRTDNLAVVRFRDNTWGSWCLLKDFINRNYNKITRIHDVAGGEQSLFGNIIWEKGPEEPEEIVLTMDEIADKLGIPVEQLRIKK